MESRDRIDRTLRRKWGVFGSRLGVGLVGIGLFVAACEGSESSADTIAREDFVQVYFDLRMAAIRQPDMEIRPADRDRILDEHGFSGDQLMSFVQAHVDRPTYMDSLWMELQSKVDSARAAANSGVRND